MSKTIIGLTGGIGSGKSYVAKMFYNLGVPVYNSDERAKEMYYKENCKEQIISLLGEKAYKEDGTLDRSYVANLIFNNQSLLTKVNSIIHPLVREDFEMFVKEYPSRKLIIHESALFFESNLTKMVDKIILVTAPEELRIKRVQKRDNATTEQIKARMDKQMSDELKIPFADFVIANDEVMALSPQVIKIFEELGGKRNPIYGKVSK